MLKRKTGTIEVHSYHTPDSVPAPQSPLPGQNLGNGMSNRNTSLLDFLPREPHRQTHLQRRRGDINLLLGSGGADASREILRARDQYALRERLRRARQLPFTFRKKDLCRSSNVPRPQYPASAAAGRRCSTSATKSRRASTQAA
jgi:hypothetical protein